MTAQFPKSTVAAVHAASVFLDLEGTVEKSVALIEEAASGGARLVAFPECFAPGYPFWIWTHTPTTGAPLFAELYANSVEIPGPATQAIGEAARRAGAYVVWGIVEREHGTLYNTLLYFDDGGRIMGRHRKLQPTHVERSIWGRGDGSDLDTFETPLGVLGGLICWEHTMDLIRYAMTAQGEQIHIAAWPAISAITHNPHSGIFDSVSEAAAKHHALSGQTFVINVQSCIDEHTLERLGLSGQPEMARAGGGWTAIIGPDGQFIAGPHTDTEQIIYGDLDLSAIVMVKYACDSAGHYARPDVARLWLDRSPQSILVAPPPGAASQPEEGAGLNGAVPVSTGESMTA